MLRPSRTPKERLVLTSLFKLTHYCNCRSEGCAPPRSPKGVSTCPKQSAIVGAQEQDSVDRIRKALEEARRWAQKFSESSVVATWKEGGIKPVWGAQAPLPPITQGTRKYSFFVWLAIDELTIIEFIDMADFPLLDDERVCQYESFSHRNTASTPSLIFCGSPGHFERPQEGPKSVWRNDPRVGPPKFWLSMSSWCCKECEGRTWCWVQDMTRTQSPHFLGYSLCTECVWICLNATDVIWSLVEYSWDIAHDSFKRRSVWVKHVKLTGLYISWNIAINTVVTSVMTCNYTLQLALANHPGHGEPTRFLHILNELPSISIQHHFRGTRNLVCSCNPWELLASMEAQ